MSHGLVSLPLKADNHYGKVTPADKATGKRLRALRKSKKVRAKDVAEAMGIQPGFLCDLEKGLRHWTEERVEGFERAIKG